MHPLLFIIITIILIASIACIGLKLTLGRCKSPVCLIGKTALITGGASGIGFQTALALAGRGCRVIIADKLNCEKAIEKIKEETGNNNIVGKHFDLASLNTVRILAKDINETEPRLDILINNAGAAGLGNAKTADGLNVGMQVNHFGPFLLTHLLVGLLKKSAPSRIVFVSSMASYLSTLNETNLNLTTNQDGNVITEFMAYCNSKLCNVIASDIFAEKLIQDGVTSNSLHPGTVIMSNFVEQFCSGLANSKFFRMIYYYLMYLLCIHCWRTAEEGAQTTIHLAIAKEVENITGRYFMDCRQISIKPFQATNTVFARNIWKASEEYVLLSPEEKL